MEWKTFLKNELVKRGYTNLDTEFFNYSPWKTNAGNVSVANAYFHNVWVYASCQAITRNIIQLPKVLDLAGTAENELIYSHPVLDVLNAPNPLMDRATFWETILLNLLLPTKSTNGGQCFLVFETMNRNGKPFSVSRGDIPTEIYPFSSEYMKPVRDEKNMLIGWELCVGSKKIPYSLDSVIRINLTDPTDATQGLSPLTSAFPTLREDMKAQAVNESFFDNNASLGGALHTKAELTTDQIREIREEWESTHKGGKNAGRDAILHSGLEYQTYQRTHTEMQFLDQRKWTRDQILAVYGVPKSEVSSYEDINYATALSANKSFWEKTLLPLDKRILESLNKWIGNIENGRYRLVTDLSNVEALQANFSEKLTQAKAMFDMHIPLNVINKRLELNLDLSSVKWADTSLVSYGLTPAEFLLDPEVIDEVPDQPVEGESGNEEAEKTLTFKRAKYKEHVKKGSAYIEDYHKEVLKPSEKRFKKTITKFFVKQRNEILDQIDAWYKANKSLLTIDKATKPKQFTLNVKEQNKILRGLMLPEYKTSISIEAQRITSEIGDIINWDMNSPEMKRILKERMKILDKINNTTNSALIRRIDKVYSIAIEQELSLADTIALLKENVKTMFNSPGRANTVSRTESGAIHSETRENMYEEAGIEEVEWLTARDEKVRGENAEFSHAMLDGVLSTRKEGFNNGEDIMHPHDPHASPSNVINCRCITRAI